MWGIFLCDNDFVPVAKLLKRLVQDLMRIVEEDATPLGLMHRSDAYPR